MCQVGKVFWLVDTDDQDVSQGDVGRLSAQSYKDVIQKLQSLPGVHRPSKKREVLQDVYDLTNKAIMAFYDRRPKKGMAVMVDNLIPILEFLIIRSGLTDICAEIDFIRKTMPNSCVNGITGFMVTTFTICLDLIEKVDYKSLIVSKIAMAQEEAGKAGGSPEALRRALYDSYNAPNSFLNGLLLDVIRKHPIGKASGSGGGDALKLTEFVKARDALEAKTRDSLKSEKLKLEDRDRGAVQRACRDAIANISYNSAMEALEKDAALKALNIRLNSGIRLMKEAVTFEMIDPEHRQMPFDMSRLDAAAAAFGDRRRSISERMRSLYELGGLAGKEGKSGAVGLALIRAGVQSLCTQVYLFNMVAIAGVEEESKAVRVLVEAERAVKHVSETWNCTAEMRRAGWRRVAVLTAVKRLTAAEDNRYGRIVAKAKRKALAAPAGKAVLDSVDSVSESIARDVLCGCPAAALPEAREAVYNTVEAAVVEPNYAAVLRLFARGAGGVDVFAYQKMCALKDALTPKRLGLSPAYCGCKEDETLGDAMAQRYISAAKALENITSENIRKTGSGELQMLRDAIDAIARSAAIVGERPVAKVEEASIVRILCFVIVRRGIKGLHGHVLFMEAFLSGNKKCEHHLSLLKEALKLIDTLFSK